MLKKILVIVIIILLLAVAGLYYVGSTIKTSYSTASLQPSQMALMATQTAACGGSCNSDYLAQLQACDQSNPISLKNCISILAPSDPVRSACSSVVDLNEKTFNALSGANEVLVAVDAVAKTDLTGINKTSMGIAEQLAKCTEEARNYRRPPA